jgi:hypothetical protein
MKTVLDQATRDELIQRIRMLHKDSQAQWGKMNVYQMLKHYTLWEDWIASTKKHKQVLIGRLFGKMALKSVLKDEKPIKRNSPTLPELVVKEQSGDVETEKLKWIAQLAKYAHFSNPGFVHSFFGEMTEEEIGYMAYKHADHHLRQFNC